MRPFTLLLLCLIAISSLIGCNAGPRDRRATALMRSEIMDLEDQFYSLKSRHERTLRELADLKGIPYVPDAANANDMEFWDEGVIIESPASGNSILNQPDSPIQSPAYDDPDTSANPDGASYRQPSPRQGFNSNSGAGSITRVGTGSASSMITEVYINPRYTGAKNVDGRPGDDGLALLIQPRQATGKTVVRSGPVTISLVDPTADQDTRRVGLWKFAAGEMDLFAIDDGSAQQGFLLHLPWDANVPRNKTLLISVQFTTPDGRTLESSKKIRIQPPTGDYSPSDPLIAKWTEQAPFSDADSERTAADKPRRNGVRAIPVKSERRPNRPQWRPVR